MNAICIIVDRLQAGYLGPYGNTWIDTPSFDRLASQSFLLPRNSYEMAEFQRSLAVVVTAVVLAGGCITAINRWLPRAPRACRCTSRRKHWPPATKFAWA